MAVALGLLYTEGIIMEAKMDCVPAASVSFSPRLWRTCRYLANVERMNVFRTVCLAAEGRGLDVNSITGLVHLRQPATSTYLRQLAECGLVTGHREKRNLFYQALPHPRIYGAARLVPILRDWFRQEACARHDWGDVCPPMPFHFVLPGLGNELRVLALKCLAVHGPCSRTDIAILTHIPDECVDFHVQVLRDCGLVTETTQNLFEYLEPADDIARMFTDLSLVG